MRQLRLIGGEADGTVINVDDDRCREGEYAETYVQRDLDSACNFNPSAVPVPESQTMWRVLYRIRVLHMPHGREFYYATPLHWKDDDGLISLFGRPRYV